MSECSGCGRAAEFRCSGCKQVAYCNTSCQTAAWRSHSSVCGPLIGTHSVPRPRPSEGVPRAVRPTERPQRHNILTRNQRVLQDAKRLDVLIRMLRVKFPHRIKRILGTGGKVDTTKLRDEARRMGIRADYPAYVAFSKLSKVWQGDDAPLSELTWFDPNGLPPNLLLDKRLGIGAYGEVWLATEATTNQQYAAKIFDDEDDLDDEGVILQWVNPVSRTGAENPNVMGYIGAWRNWVPPGSASGIPRPLLVSEYINGLELADILRSNHAAGWRAWYDINWFAEQMFNGLAFLHQKGVAHRDFKMNNVMVHAPYNDSDGNHRYGRIVIIDLGLSCVVDDVSREARLLEKACTQPDALRQGGAWVYLSPEIADFYVRNRALEMQRVDPLAAIPSPDMSIQYSNDVWAAAHCLVGVILGTDTPRYLMPTLYTGEDVDHYLTTIQAAHGPAGADQLAAGERGMTASIRILADLHMQKARGVDDAEKQRWQSAMDVLAEISDLFTSIEKRASANAVLVRIRAFNEVRASANPPQVWRDGNAIKVAELTPYDVVV